MQKSDQFVQVGQVLKSNGTDGSLVIRLFDNYFEGPRNGGDFSLFYGTQIVETPFWIMIDGLPVPFFSEIREDKGGSKILVRLTGVNSMEDADELAGKELYLKVEAGTKGFAAAADSLEDMDFDGWALAAANKDGNYRNGNENKQEILGTIIGIERIPGNPLLTVNAGDKGEVLIPLHDDFVAFVDIDKKILGMSLPEGLL